MLWYLSKTTGYVFLLAYGVVTLPYLPRCMYLMCPFCTSLDAFVTDLKIAAPERYP
jgi:hypothetical protein